MATLHDINHNAGGAVTNFWDNETDPSAGVSVGVAGGLNGTANGLIIDTTIADTMNVWSTYTPPGSGIRGRIYFDPNGNDNLSDNAPLFYFGIGDGDFSIGNALFRVELTYDWLISDRLELNIVHNGGNNFTQIVPADEPHCLEFNILRGASSDAEINLWFDGVFQETISGFTNDTLFEIGRAHV